jgi:hypothetical protein
VKLVLFVEGWTEKSLPSFLKRWLDPRLPEPVGIQAVRFEGVADYLKGVAKKAALRLQEPDVLAVIGLVDLYGLPLSWPRNTDADARVVFARQQITERIDPNMRPRFRQHFAVHETEAWLLADPALFPGISLPPRCSQPETVDFETPPAKLLDELHRRARGRGYKKVTHGSVLFQRLDPASVYAKCPHFRALMDDMLALAQAG